MPPIDNNAEPEVWVTWTIGPEQPWDRAKWPAQDAPQGATTAQGAAEPVKLPVVAHAWQSPPPARPQAARSQAEPLPREKGLRLFLEDLRDKLKDAQ